MTDRADDEAGREVLRRAMRGEAVHPTVTRMLNTIFLSGHERQPSGWVVIVDDPDLGVETYGPFDHPRDAEADLDRRRAGLEGCQCTVVPLYDPED